MEVIAIIIGVIIIGSWLMSLASIATKGEDEYKPKRGGFDNL
jgi:hypothetical protein